MGIFFSIILIIAAIVFAFIFSGSGNKQKKAFQEALGSYKDHLLNESIKKFEALLYEEPYNSLYHWYLGLLYLQRQEYTTAEYHFENLIQIKNYTLPEEDLPDIELFDEPGVRKKLIGIYQNLKLKDKLISQYEILSKMDPGNDAYPLSIAEILIEDKDYSDRPQKLLEHALKVNTKNGRAQFLLSLIYFKNDKFDEALQSAEKTISFDRSMSDAYFIIGYVRYRLNLKEEAERYFRDAALCKYFRKSNSYYLAKVLSSLGKLDFALSYAKESVKYSASIHENPDIDIDSRFLLGTLLEQQDEFDEALKLYQYIQQIRPDYQDVSKRIKYMTSPVGPAGKEEKSHEHIKADYLETYRNMKLDVFTQTSEKIMENLGYKIKKVDMVDNQTVNLIVLEDSNPNEQIGVFIRRGIGIIQEDHIKKILHFMSGLNVNSAFLITPNDFNPSARKMAEKKAIKTINGEKLRELLTNAVK